MIEIVPPREFMRQTTPLEVVQSVRDLARDFCPLALFSYAIQRFRSDPSQGMSDEELMAFIYESL